MKKILLTIILSSLLFCQIIEKQNKLLWDGSDWKQISNRADVDTESVYRIKSAYLNGVLDGRLYYYLKAWGEKQAFADSIYGDRVDYMTTRETIRQLDQFYQDNLMSYVPVVSAIIIVHMHSEQIPKKIINDYIDQTIKSEFEKNIIKKMKKQNVGDPFLKDSTVGPMVDIS